MAGEPGTDGADGSSGMKGEPGALGRPGVRGRQCVISHLDHESEDKKIFNAQIFIKFSYQRLGPDKHDNT